MPTTFTPSKRTAAIRSGIDHPIIDADGHHVEFLPLVEDYIREIADGAVADRFHRIYNGVQGTPWTLPLDERRASGVVASGFWALPTENTLDRATSMLPALMYSRMEEIGLDFAIVYPSHGIGATSYDDAELRQAGARAFNTYHAEVFAGLRDRLEPVATIPSVTPDEAITEIDYVVNTLGLRTIMMSGVIRRTHKTPDGTVIQWLDHLGHESSYDYDPVWAKCLELGVVPTFHAKGAGWGSRVSATNYVYNHLGDFASAQEAVCRSLLLGGAPRRFPELRFAFLEGGVAWASQLYSDALSHFEKRNKDSIHRYDPKLIDHRQYRELFAEYATQSLATQLDRCDEGLLISVSHPRQVDIADDFAESGITCAEDIADIFDRQFYFGCEADDPLNSLAFNRHLLPHSIQLNAIFASDVSHWDVPDMREVLPEAWELVDNGHLGSGEFRAFTFGNIADMLTESKPEFFAGTAVGDAVRAHLATR
jgi:predicted TIM-barrel fold metal-dependent hydrolase